MIKEKHYDPVFHPQSHFRSVLDSMARPGKRNTLLPISIQPAGGLRMSTASVALALINRDVGFHVVGFEPDAVEYLKANRNSPLSTLEEADFIIQNGFPSRETIKFAKPGVLTYPETSASIIAQIGAISDEPIHGSLKITLKGPGIRESCTVYLEDGNPETFEALMEKNDEFPLGIDLIFTTYAPENADVEQVFCIPRSCKIQL